MIFKIILAFSLMAFGLKAADSGSMSKSCSGRMEVCNGSSCTKKYFYIYAYQYAIVSKQMIQSESHSFSFAGVLGDEDDYQIVQRVSGNHIIYVGPEFTLAIPFKRGNPIMAAQGVPGPGPSDWQILCE